MKKNVLLTFVLISSLFFSCGEDNTSDVVINVNGNGSTTDEAVELEGRYTTDLTLDADLEYLLTGSLIMEGTTLTIPAGTTIKAMASGSDIYIAIAQGAKINAEGTATKPIVLTSNSIAPRAGDWGGLIVLGKAPINSVADPATQTSTSEIGGLAYGGNDEADNSGVIKYVRVQYSGGKADGQSENNGFSFYGVGNGTVVENIQMYEGLDDGVEFFGGTVNVTNVAIVNAQDDSIDWTEGYTGTITNAYVQHGADHDKGIEADGYNTDIGNLSSPAYFSKPTVTNLTIIGLGSSTGNEAVRLRAGTQGVFSNVVIKGFEEGFDLDGDSGDNPTGAGVLSGDLSVSNVTFTDVTLNVKNDTGETFTDADFISGEGEGTGTDVSTWGAGWTVGIN